MPPDLRPDLCSASQNTVLTDFSSFSLYRWRLFPPSGCTDPKSSWHLFHTVIAAGKQDQPCLSNVVCIVRARAAVWGFNDLQWIVFPNDGLTICEVPGEGDGPFAAEHPPDLMHRQREREARKWNIYQRQNTFMIALNIYLTIKEKKRTLPLLLCTWRFCFLGKESKADFSRLMGFLFSFGALNTEVLCMPSFSHSATWQLQACFGNSACCVCTLT